MILKAIIKVLLSLFFAPSTLVSSFVDMSRPPSFSFTWVDDVLPYFECIRYIIPLDQLAPLFVCIIAILVVRIVVAVIRLFVGKIIPVW